MSNYPEEARDLLVRLARYANTLTPHKLDDPIDPLVAAALDQALSQLCELVRESVGQPLNYKEATSESIRLMVIGATATEEAIRTKWTLKEKVMSNNQKIDEVQPNE